MRKTLVDFNAGKLLSEIVKKEVVEEKSQNRRRILENQRENCPPKKPNIQSAKSPEENANQEKNRFSQSVYEKEITTFNVLFPDVFRPQVNSIRASLTILKYVSNHSQITLGLRKMAPLNISQYPEKWTLVGVPGV